MILTILSVFLMTLGCVIMFTAALGLMRFSTINMRLHASGKAGTGGTLALLIGILVYTGIDEISGKIILIIVLVLFTGPIISHAIARAAFIDPEIRAEVPIDEYPKLEKKKEGN
ncbi:MAG: monovalent cation/H(+) antiporter subunit G [Candidatus Saliniplasma sp.]